MPVSQLLSVAGSNGLKGSGGIAVGTAIAGRPPHGSVRAELPHTALAGMMPRITARCGHRRTLDNPHDLAADGFPSRTVAADGTRGNCLVFSSASPLPSLDSAGTVPLFADFFGTMELSDSPTTCMLDV